MALSDLLVFVRSAQDCKSFSRLARLTSQFMKDHGIEIMSYHHLPPPGAYDRRSYVTVATIGFPKEWVERYTNEQYYKVDPIPKKALNSAHPFWWSECIADCDVGPEGRAYLDELSRAKLGDGLAVPVFGPNMRNGYVGLGCGTPDCCLNETQVLELQCACQMGHLRYCELLAADMPEPAALSDREREILGWMAKGKSNSVIADILQLSPNTVDTYSRRIFKKLDVADRVTATLRGYAVGAID